LQFSHSRIESFEQCKYKWKLHYLDEIQTLDDYEPTNALVLGHALHTGIEKGVQAGVDEYLNYFPVISTEIVTEQIKLECRIQEVLDLLPDGYHEVPIYDADFIGFIDYLTPVPGSMTEFDLWDYKYTSSDRRYKDSDQLHLYKYWFERLNPQYHIRNMNYVIVPKVNLKQGKKETIFAYREKIKAEMAKKPVYLLPVTYDESYVIDFFRKIKKVYDTKDFEKEPSPLCQYCDYYDYCQKGIDYMLLPKNERRTMNEITRKKIWLYGAPFSGKTYFANEFPDPLMLNTDGNVQFVDAPYILIKDQVSVEGRITKTQLAWDYFKEVITELEKKQNDFETIVVDLVEDLYEACRIWKYKDMGISHESDDPFKAWDMIRTEFLSTMRKLMNLDYGNIILISHEDTSKDITRKNDKVTAIKPNIQDKVANKLAGMVDIVARLVADDKKHTIGFKSAENIFGGGRLEVGEKEIEADYSKFLQVYEEANSKAKATVKKEEPKKEASKFDQFVEESEPEQKEPDPEPEPEQKEPEPEQKEPDPVPVKEEHKTKVRTRKVRE